MSNPTLSNSVCQRPDDEVVSTVFKKCNYTDAKPLATSLQGSVWTATGPQGEHIAIKVTKKKLHQQSMSTEIGGAQYPIQENIKKEAQILHHLTVSETIKHGGKIPKSIVKYVDFFQSKTNYYLVMENGGSSLFDFVVKAHQLIACDKLDVSEWHKCVKVIYKQLLDALQYMHSEGIVHYDISLENMVINDVELIEDVDTSKISFVTERISVKVIDFGLADVCRVDPAGFIDCTSTKFVGKQIYKSPEVQRKKQAFNAMSNDVFCSGVCLYMMVFGSPPWERATMNDPFFHAIMTHGIVYTMYALKRTHLVTGDILQLLSQIFQYEKSRITLSKILQHAWMQQN